MEGNSSWALPGALDEGNESCVLMDAPVQTRLDLGDHDCPCRATTQAGDLTQELLDDVTDALACVQLLHTERLSLFESLSLRQALLIDELLIEADRTANTEQREKKMQEKMTALEQERAAEMQQKLAFIH